MRGGGSADHEPYGPRGLSRGKLQIRFTFHYVLYALEVLKF